jgi:glycosyltransferase involved in cell wall biosynthesis
MRVLFNTYSTAFFVPGGGEAQLLKTREHLQRLGVEVDLYNPWEPAVERYDVVHMFSARSGSWPFHDMVRERRVPLVLSPILWLKNGGGQFPIHDIYHLFHRSDLVLPNSEAELDAFDWLYNLPREHFRVVYNGIDPRLAEGPGAELFRKTYPHRDFLLCVANVEPRKNQLALVQACQGLNRPLLLVGGVREQAYLDKCLDAGRDFVHYLGRFEAESDLLKSAYQACDAHVLASHFETPGLASMEAAALGARVVSTEVGCAREYFGDLAHYVSPNDIPGIRTAIEAALRDPRDTAALRCRMLENFTWRHTAQQTLAAYEEVLARKGRAAKP